MEKNQTPGLPPIVENSGNPYEAVTSISLSVGIASNQHSDTEVMVLIWALTSFRRKQIDQLVRDMYQPEDDYTDAGDTLSAIGYCDQMLTNLTIGLHDAALRNAELLALLETPSRSTSKDEVKDWAREQLGSSILRIVKGK